MMEHKGGSLAHALVVFLSLVSHACGGRMWYKRVLLVPPLLRAPVVPAGRLHSMPRPAVMLLAREGCRRVG